MDKHSDFRLGSFKPGNPVMEPLGRYFAEFSTVEFGLVMLFSHVLGYGDDNDVPMAIFGRIRNIADRIEILRDVAAKSKLVGDGVSASVNELCDEFVKVNARRNCYAHAVYQSNNAGEVQLTSYVMTASRKKVKEILTVEQIEKDIRKVQALLVLVIIRLGKFPPDLLEAWQKKRAQKNPSSSSRQRRGK